jgi:hypothetical protein
MKLILALYCGLFMATAATAQERGRLAVTVQTRSDSSAPVGRAIGAKVIVVHWTHSQLHSQIVQDEAATTDQKGTCTIELPPGTYDIFITGRGLTPLAVKRDVEAGETTPLVVSLKPESMHLRPVAQ